MQRNSVNSDILTNRIGSKLNRTDRKYRSFLIIKYMKKNEQKICSFTQKGTRLQLLKLTETYIQIEHNQNFIPYETDKIYYKHIYQVRLNRKIIDTSISEYEMRKVFATYCQNIVLQLKIY